MIINTKPNDFVTLPNGTGMKFLYIALNPSSPVPGRVKIEALFYKSEEVFFYGQNCGGAYLGEIEFNINDAGLLDAVEAFALVSFPDFEHCNVPVAPINEGE